MADDDKSVGTYARLSLVDADGNELEKHYARTFNPSNPASKRPDDEAWVAAKWGEKFGVKVVGLKAEVYVYKLFIDGTMMRSFYMQGGGTSIFKEVCTSTIGSRSVYRPLIFAQPDFLDAEGGGGGGGAEVPLAQQMAGEGINKLGRITVEVWDAVRTAPQVVTGTVTKAQYVGGGKMNEKALIKKGAFASTTKLGSEERVVMDRGGGGGGGGFSEYRTGYNKMETVELRYGHVSQLLILGCPPAKFRVQQGPLETVELYSDEEEEEEKGGGRKRAAVKKEGDTKRVKAEPGTGGGGGGGGGGDDAKAGGGADADGVWDLT